MCRGKILCYFFKNMVDIDIVFILYIMYIYNKDGEVTHLQIIISNAGDKPIYEQIVSQIKAMIISGQLKEGDALPSMRVLAKELRISVITTKRAYEELEKEGYLVSFTGKGSFVAGKNLNLVKEQQLRMIEELLQQIVEGAQVCNLQLEELIEMLVLVYEGE